MTARVLVVDDIISNVKLLEARLTTEYFEVVTAMNGPRAVEIATQAHCDIVLLDVMMPEMDGFEVCRRIKLHPMSHHIPVIMVTALDQPEDRVRGLEAGADDFLTKPVSDIALVTRVRSLVRLKLLTDELRLRASTSQQLGLDDPLEAATRVSGEGGRLLIVDDRSSSHERLATALGKQHHVTVEPRPQEALFRIADGDFDVVIVSLGLEGYDGLRLCSQIRTLERTRHLPILVLTEPEDNQKLLRGLDLGVNDYIVRPVDRNELIARVATQVRRKRYGEKLRDNVQLSMTMAITDPLTGLYNRRYMESHLETLAEQAVERGRALSLLMLDIDYFKAVNDTHGHDVGDDVLREFGSRIRKAVRGIDLTCRMGGEEFVVVMPETDLAYAMRIGERIRQEIATEPFVGRDGTALLVTASIGVAAIERADDTPDSLIKRADKALYAAKRDGRNRVVADAA
jgi:two-component system, cell cycle response regulator